MLTRRPLCNSVFARPRHLVWQDEVSPFVSNGWPVSSDLKWISVLGLRQVVDQGIAGFLHADRDLCYRSVPMNSAPPLSTTAKPGQTERRSVED